MRRLLVTVADTLDNEEKPRRIPELSQSPTDWMCYVTRPWNHPVWGLPVMLENRTFCYGKKQNFYYLTSF